MIAPSRIRRQRLNSGKIDEISADSYSEAELFEEQNQHKFMSSIRRKCGGRERRGKGFYYFSKNGPARSGNNAAVKLLNISLFFI